MIPLLAPSEHIVTVYAEPASGPGWSNSPLWVVVRAVDGSLREECIQPPEQTNEMVLLYAIAACVHQQLKRAVIGAALPAGKVAAP